MNDGVGWMDGLETLEYLTMLQLSHKQASVCVSASRLFYFCRVMTACVNRTSASRDSDCGRRNKASTARC